MPVCPRGHQSQSTDYCDECGTPIGGSVPPAAAPAPSSTAASSAVCPDCGTPASGRFCEVCGHDFVMAKLSPAGTGATGADLGGSTSAAANAGTSTNAATSTS